MQASKRGGSGLPRMSISTTLDMTAEEFIQSRGEGQVGGECKWSRKLCESSQLQHAGVAAKKCMILPIFVIRASFHSLAVSSGAEGDSSQGSSVGHQH